MHTFVRRIVSPFRVLIYVCVVQLFIFHFPGIVTPLTFPYHAARYIPSYVSRTSPVLHASNNRNNEDTTSENYASSSTTKQQQQYQHPKKQYSKKQQSINVGYDPLLSLNMNLDALACAQAPDRAQELYYRIYALYKDGYYSVPPDIVSFNSVLKAWQYHPEKALEFWESIVNTNHISSDSNSRRSTMMINIVSYNTFLLALARSGMYEQAESLLEYMQAYNAPIRPDSISFNTVLLSYAVAMSSISTTAKRTHQNISDANDIGHKAEQLLHKMINGTISNNNNDDGINNVGNKRSNFTVLPSVIDINYRPPPPNTFSYNTVISTWAEHPDVHVGANKAEHWLQAMNREALTGINKKGSDDYHNNDDHLIVRPDVYTYTTVMKALSRCRHPTIASRVTSLLQQMRTGDNDIRPNVITYTTAINALCYNQQMDVAYKLLNEMIQTSDVYPDTCTFTTMFNGFASCATEYSKHNDSNNCQKVLLFVQKLYQQMMELRNNVSPDERTYTSVLTAYAATRQYDIGSYARQVLSDMLCSKIQPSSIHYNAALNCYAKSISPYKVIDAEKLWKEMIQAGHESCTITYNTLLYAASTVHFYTTRNNHNDIRQQSLRIGQYVFDTLHNDSYCVPTSSTYKFYFNMLHRLLPKQHNPTTLSKSTTFSLPKVQNDRIELYKRAFTLCCKNGCLDQTILDCVLKSITETEAKLLFHDDENNCHYYDTRHYIKTLPQEWSSQ